MSGWIYLIRNGDLHKIGITKNINKRIKQLKPDEVLVKSYIFNFKYLEKALHYRYKKVRIPQTEYFRLNKLQIRECKKLININSYRYYSFYRIFISVLISVSLVFIIFVIFNYWLYKDWSDVFYHSIFWTEKYSVLLMFLSLFSKSNMKLKFINDFKYRIKKTIIYLFFSLLLYSISNL